jgi:cytochrome P450
MHTGFLQKAKSLGGIIGFYLGSRYCVILQTRQAIQDSLVKHAADYADRSSAFVKLACNPFENGIIDRKYNAEFRRSHHRSLTILRQFGFGQGIMETRINMEVEELVSWIKEMKGQEFFPDPLLAKCVMNIIGSIIFGRRFSRDDAERDQFIADVYKFVHDLMKVFPINAFPLLRFIPGFRGNFLSLCNTHARMMTFVEQNIVRSLKDDTNLSFVSSYKDTEGSSYDPVELSYIIRDLVVAGTETSVTTIRWSLVTFANHPQIQSQIQKEIDSVVPRSRLPSLDDRPNLPYLEATILELMRRRTVAPLSIPRETSCDTEVSGYFIPAKSMVFASLYAVHMNPDVWSDPESFRPERFLDENGKVIGKDRVIPFGLGRRSCLGELLARQEAFLFIAGLLQRFNICPPDGQQYIECHDVLSITMAPSPFSVRLTDRQTN